MSDLYTVRIKCVYGEGEDDWHYYITTQLTLDDELVCPTHEGSTCSAFAIIGFPAEVDGRAGYIPAANFSGKPQKAAVTFDVPYSSTDYTISFTALVTEDSNACWIPSAEDISVNGFTVNMNAYKINDLIGLKWACEKYTES